MFVEELLAVEYVMLCYLDVVDVWRFIVCLFDLIGGRR